MEILQTPTFRRAVQKLHGNQKKDLDKAVRAIAADPSIGSSKVGDLAGVRVYKFQMTKQMTLLAYSYEDDTVVLTLLTFGSHENFYRDLKRSG
jgi:mRNA-degrading endonuclease RelE of RelBE toxin-antitoxin system